MATALAPLVVPTVGAAHSSRAARPGIARRRSRRLCPRRRPRRRRPCHRVHAITVSMSFHRACHTVCVCARAHLACHVGVRVHARFTRMRHVRMRMKRKRESESEREREREREARERSASPNYIVYGKMQHDRAGSARHEGPVLPSGEREPGLIARGPSDHEHLGRRLQRGGAPRRLPASGVLRPACGAEGA